MSVLTQTNPVYKGYTRWNCFCSETKTKKEQAEWIIKKGHHPAILSEELFEKAQERYQAEHHPQNTRASACYQHWLSGIIKCSACGRSLSYNRVYREKQNHSFFQCYGYSKKLCSVSHGISERKIVSAVLNSLQDAIGTDTKFEPENNPREKESQKEITYLIQTQLKKQKEKEERISAAYADGIDTLEEYKKKKQKLLEEREKLEKEIEHLKEKKYLEKETEYLEISDIRTLLVSDNFSNAEKNEAVRTIIEQIIYDKANKTVLIYYRCLEKKKEFYRFSNKADPMGF